MLLQTLGYKILTFLKQIYRGTQPSTILKLSIFLFFLSLFPALNTPESETTPGGEWFLQGTNEQAPSSRRFRLRFTSGGWFIMKPMKWQGIHKLLAHVYEMFTNRSGRGMWSCECVHTPGPTGRGWEAWGMLECRGAFTHTVPIMRAELKLSVSFRDSTVCSLRAHSHLTSPAE